MNQQPPDYDDWLRATAPVVGLDIVELEIRIYSLAIIEGRVSTEWVGAPGIMALARHFREDREWFRAAASAVRRERKAVAP